MALFGRNTFDEMDNDYVPLEEFAPTISKQEVVKRRKVADLIAPIRDIPIALKGRRDQIENDLNSFCIDQDSAFRNTIENFDDMVSHQKDHIADVKTLKNTMDQVLEAAESLGETIAKEPESPKSRTFLSEVEIPQIDLAKISEEYMPDAELVEQIRSYSSFSHILKKSVEYAFSAIEQYDSQIKKLTAQKDELSDLASQADLLALHTTIEATHMDEENQEFSKKVAGQISDLSRKIHDISAALDAELDILENGLGSMRSSLNTIESAHRDCVQYADMYSAASNEYYRQSTNYTNILIQSLSTLNKDFRQAMKKKDTSVNDYLRAFDSFTGKISKSYKQLQAKNDGVKGVMAGCIRGASSLSEEMDQTMALISEVRETLLKIAKSDELRKSKYSQALLKAFDQDLLWLSNKIEDTFDKATDEV